jgi:hypothetical protein
MRWWLGGCARARARIQRTVDQRALNQALARFEGFKSNLPPSISEDCVREYQAIVDALSAASGETLNAFKIGDAELEYKVIGSQRRSFSGRPGRVIRSNEKSCDSARFQRQIDGLSHYLESQGYRKAKSAPARPARATHSVHVEHMHGSAIQQGTSRSPVTINFDAKNADFSTLIQDIKAKIPSLKLDQSSKLQLASDVATIEAQITSPAPKKSIIAECLSSARAVLEIAAGDVVAAGLMYEIAKYLR